MRGPSFTLRMTCCGRTGSRDRERNGHCGQSGSVSHNTSGFPKNGGSRRDDRCGCLHGWGRVALWTGTWVNRASSQKPASACQCPHLQGQRGDKCEQNLSRVNRAAISTGFSAPWESPGRPLVGRGFLKARKLADERCDLLPRQT
jgi:hypothetical protein